jgi:tetratricopeptide (TPR) repeat protein
MLKKFLFAVVFLISASSFVPAQTNTDTVMILPFENASGQTEFNWVGESFASSLSDLLKVPGLNVVSNDERKIIQQKLRVPLTILPSLATSLKLARQAGASLLVAGRYQISPAQGDAAAAITVTAKIIRVNEGRFLSEEFPDGRRITRDINLSDALQNLQTIQGQMAYQILYQRDKALPFRLNDFVEKANKVSARAFEAYIKGLLTSETDLQTREGYLKNALRIYAEDEKTKGEVYTDAALELGHFYLNQRKFSEASAFFGTIVNEVVKCRENAEREKIIPQCKDENYAEAAFYTGLIHWQQQNYEQAIAVLRPIAEDLKLTSVYNTIGAIAVQAARTEKKNKGKSAALLNEGIEYLKKAAESAPDEPDILFNFGLALFLKNDYVEALAQLRPVLALRPRDGEAYFLLAKAAEILQEKNAADFDNMARQNLVAGDRYAKMQVEWSRSKTVDTINLRVNQPPRKDFVSVILVNRQIQLTPVPVNETEAMLTQARKLYAEAMEILRRILVSEPMSAESYYLLGMLHLRRADSDQAVSSLKTALFWDNRLIDAYTTLVRIYVEKRECQQAKTYLASAAEIINQSDRNLKSSLSIEDKKQEIDSLQRLVEKCSTK